MLSRLVPILILLIAAPTLAAAQESAQQSPATGEPLTVAIKEAPPFALRDAEGNWTGLSVDLWEEVAALQGLDFSYSEQTLDEIFDGLEAGTNDVALGALSITSDREARVDFSHGYYRSGLGIAVPAGGGGGPFSFLSALISWQFFSAVLTLFVLLLGVGAVIWLAERRHNPDEFGGSTAHGLGKGLWWSAVTMTTVGYGDKSPRTLAGRLIGLAWMFTSIIIIAGMTGALASAFTVSTLESDIEGPEDLRGKRVATVIGSSSADWLANRNIRRETYDTPLAALEALADGDHDAAVYDAPLMRFLIEEELGGDLTVLRPSFERESYGIAFPQGSTLREGVDRALLDLTSGGEWEARVFSYTGEDNV